MLIDDVSITVTAGNGGNGKVSFGVKAHSGPDGGNGGKGGDIYATVTSDLFTLSQLAKHKRIKTEDGGQGGKNKKTGRNGKDLILKIPLGSAITDLATGHTVELTDLDMKMTLCRGGSGGFGNHQLRSPTNTTPRTAESGQPGQIKKLHINLRFIAKFGLIGLPNAGKSSILNEVTSARAKVGNYPFTTLETNLGVYKGKVIADIPGLIEGAAEGKGLGTKFLKHVEKVKLLLHCISAESEDVVKDYEVINAELAKFSPELLTKKRVILLTKTDLVTATILKRKQTQLEKYNWQILHVSIYDPEAIQQLLSILDKR